MAQIVAMHDGIELYGTTNDLPFPDNSVEVRANSELIGYQWFAASNTLETIDFTKWGTDPKDNSYFSYYITQDKKFFQLMTFLEEQENLLWMKSIEWANADYEDRYPAVYGRKLGILTDEKNVPVQEIPDVTSEWFIDIGTSTGTYIAHITDSEKITGDGTTLIRSHPNFNCKRVRQVSGARWSKDYIILPYGVGLTAYCHVDFPQFNFFDFIDDGDMENDAAQNWSQNANVFKTTEDSVSFPTSLKIDWYKTLYSNNFTYIKPNSQYRLEWSFKSVGWDQATLYYGYAQYDENVRQIRHHNISATPGSDTTLVSDVIPTDMSIEVVDRWGTTCDVWNVPQWSNWPSDYRVIAFDTDDSGAYNDLPNYNTSAYVGWEPPVANGFASVVDNWATCTINLKRWVWLNYPAGTNVRVHRVWSTHNYIAASNDAIPGTWTQFTGAVEGISLYGNDNNYFRRGTRFVRIFIIWNYKRYGDEELLIDDLKLVEL